MSRSAVGSLGWVLSGATRVSKEKFSFLSGLEIQPKQTRRFSELLVMKMNPLLLVVIPLLVLSGPYVNAGPVGRSEEHTSELQSHSDLVCRLLLEKKKDD